MWHHKPTSVSFDRDFSESTTASGGGVCGTDTRLPRGLKHQAHLQVGSRVGCVLATQQWRGERATYDLANLLSSTLSCALRHRATLLSLALALAVTSTARADVKVGDPFPALGVAGLVTLAGGDLPATTGKVVLVDFWASWCAPCKASFPMMTKLHQEYASRGLVIAAVGIDEKAAAATAFVKKLAPVFPTLHDQAQNLVKQVVVPAMPTSYLIGRDGRVRFMHQGFHGDRTENELRKNIEILLAEKS
jgi:thiol-disulfide isomerase/thioredoxin